ncbi:hypothetical protein L873DRAFT_1825387 [Choiromyces venosus 120613-1]|uniref:Dynein light intermediate chain n=1 Tax=Choiromyces venosus 120613-1 TaxID=1336337 RepID=A0A3N4K3R7_9PEZI|nr:hypothetical protein L873DRAFT_1825387 [Choiromyces venosus 120613-1]
MDRTGGFDERPGSAMSNTSSNKSEKEDMWSSMLSSVASSKRLPHKSILVLGGSAEGQKEFVESLGGGAGSSTGGGNRKGEKRPPIANEFALGYTYLDVLDADHEDVLARLGVYLISEPTPSFIPLLQPLFTPATLPETLVVVLLDWSKPWDWMRSIKTWVRLLRGIFTSLDDDCRRTLDEVTHAWETRRSTYTDAGGGEVTIPLGPGEFDEPLGLPLCVVCYNADKIEMLERERGWKEEAFDFVLQFLRTVLLKHGASLIYTTPSVPSPLRPLILSLLSIQSSSRQQSLKHNVIDRDKVLVPPHWDSWGKIRVLREGFDVEGIGSGWSIDISPGSTDQHGVEDGAVEIYEEVIKDPKRGDPEGLNLLNKSGGRGGIEVPAVDTQVFLAGQLELLEAKAAEEMAARGGKEDKYNTASGERVMEHVGPVQFNVGGIQVDAENMLERLKEREQTRASEREPGSPNLTSSDGKSQNEVLSAFFTSLMKKKGITKGASPGS